jgi:hypothetical protein
VRLISLILGRRGGHSRRVPFADGLPGAATFFPFVQSNMHDNKLMAFYQPQFLPVPEDAAWRGNDSMGQ